MKQNYLFICSLIVMLLMSIKMDAQDTVIENTKAGELSSLITDKNISSLVVKGEINRSDLDYINNYLTSLKNLDLRETTITEWTDPYDPEWGIYPANVFPSSFTANSVIERLVLPESITYMGISCLNNPSKLKKLISYAAVPPSADDYYPFIGSGEFLSRCVLYVPKESIEVYKNAPGWDFTVIKDIESEGSEDPSQKKDFELSSDGKTLVKWLGTNAVIDMNAYEELANVEIIGSAAFGTADYFGSNNVITEVTLSDNIKEIGDNAFSNCLLLQKVNLGSKVQNIGVGAFMGCEKLDNVVLPASVTSIGRACFSGCSMLSNIEWPVDITELPNSVFYRCSSLTSIIIPSKVTVINNSVFEECSALKSISWGSSLQEIGYSAFAYCNALTKVELPATLKTIGEECFVSCESLKEVAFGGTENIGASAFKSCALSKADFGTSNIKEIGVYAFSNNPLTEVNLPNSITVIGDCAFQNCSEITSISIPAEAPVESLNDRVFKLCSKLVTFDMGSIKSIGNGTFAMCENIENITWSKNLVSIGGTAFMSCYKLASVVLPESVQYLDDWAFYECKGLKNFSAGNGLATIGQECFALCSALNSVEIGNGLTMIKKWAFQKNAALESFKVMTNAVPNLEEDVFTECNLSAATLIVAEGMKTDYNAAAQWQDFGNIEEYTATGIGSVADDNDIKAIYDINGNRISVPSKGINVVMMKDGKVKKVIVK